CYCCVLPSAFRTMTEDAVKVCVRFRPLLCIYPSELPRGSSGRVHRHVLLFADRVFTAEESTDQLYRDIAKPLVVSTVGGYNGTMFAYGQTCSGKTFTMMGSEHAPGVIPLAMEDVFQTIKKKEFLLRVSYMEIYNETVTDLLVDHWKRKPLEVREGMNVSSPQSQQSGHVC
uniref:Kinesin motor domain-containing protein n=1 Tax=Oryzias melastigma TaxID=30732 RepID=A0A3B3BG69_ORYME